MILNKITLTDFGTFRGRHEIELRPKAGRPIVLFGGKNGVGKSTVLEAIRVCFYGPAALGLRTSRDAYLTYLEGKIHRNPTCIIQPHQSEISIEFDFGDVDGTHTYLVTRSWERKGSGRVADQLTITRDRQSLDEVSSEHWDDFLRDLVPFGVSRLFFFDGEKIQSLAEDSSDQATLAEAVNLLLGVDLIEQLDTDLRIYVSRLAKDRKQGERSAIGDIEEELSVLRQRLEGLRQKQEEKRKEHALIHEAVALCEQKLSAGGGAFAKNRGFALAEQKQLRARIGEIRQEIRDLCAGLLPFALAPRLCQKLGESLNREIDAEKLQALQEISSEARARIKKALRQSSLAASTRKSLEATIEEILDALVDERRTPVIHGYSRRESSTLLRWIEEATLKIPTVLKEKSIELERLTRREQRLEAELKKTPEEESIRPLIEMLKEKSTLLADANHQLMQLEEEIRSTQLHATDVERRYDAEVQVLSRDAAQEQRLSLAPKIREVLQQFRSILVARKVRELEIAVTDAFNVLCRKKDAMRQIGIDPSSFAVVIKDRDGRPIPKTQLSAGEKQIYAISVLWALAKVSGRPLPVIIDTPLARLDRDHRDLLAKHYFPQASHQVLVLSTDTEVDEGYFEKLSAFISRAYLLDFSPDEACTSVQSGYFWRQHREAVQIATV